MDYFLAASRWLADLIFPAYCLGCSRTGEALCHACELQLPTAHQQQCIVCRRPAPGGYTCAGCRARTAVDRVLAAGPADHPLLSSAIHAFKYRSVANLAVPLADHATRTLALSADTASLLWSNPLVTAVPLHPRRRAERGFNQAELLARRIAATTAMPYDGAVLVRKRHTASQVKTGGRAERLENLKDAFVCTQSEAVCGRDVVIVDDVCTTGATIGACAQALKSSGARTVTAVVLARG